MRTTGLLFGALCSVWLVSSSSFAAAYDTVVQKLNQAVVAHPELVEMFEIGKNVKKLKPYLNLVLRQMHQT